MITLKPYISAAVTLFIPSAGAISFQPKQDASAVMSLRPFFKGDPGPAGGVNGTSAPTLSSEDW